MNVRSLTSLWLLAWSILLGCGSTTETQETQSTTQTQPAPKQPGMDFETKTDTIAMERAHTDSAGAHEGREIEIRFMVQIGAFKDPQLATSVQTTARERYHLPVLNDFNPAFSLYQIRIGFFETKEDAYDFRQRMQGDFPADYRDAWVVQLKR